MAKNQHNIAVIRICGNHLNQEMIVIDMSDRIIMHFDLHKHPRVIDLFLEILGLKKVFGVQFVLEVDLTTAVWDEVQPVKRFSNLGCGRGCQVFVCLKEHQNWQNYHYVLARDYYHAATALKFEYFVSQTLYTKLL